MKKNVLILILIFLLCVAGAAAGYIVSQANLHNDDVPQQETHLDLRGAPLPPMEDLAAMKHLATLDLRDTGLTAAQYLLLTQQLPDCQILWSVPFQGQYYPQDTTSLHITQLAQEDIEQLSFFPQLSQIDASGCYDYDLLQSLQAQYPQYSIRYQVSVAGQAVEHTATSLQVQDPVLEELEAVLPYLSELQTVTLTGTLPTNEELHALQLAYPNIRFAWTFSLCGVEVSTQDTTVDLSGIPMESTQEVESSLPYFYDLERVEMCDCGISNEEMDALGKRNPDVRFIWTVSIGWKIRMRTDATYLMPSKYETILDNNDIANLKYCIDIVCIDLGHHDVTDLSFVAYMPHLKYLVLADTAVSDISPLACLQELEYLELFSTEVRDYSPLISCTNLKDLNICYATPRDGSALAQITSLENLYLKEWRVVPYLEELQQALPNTNIVYRTDKASSATGDGWRDLPRYFEMRDILGMHYMEG